MSKPNIPMTDMPSPQQLDKINRPLSDEELTARNVKEKIEALINFFDLHGIDYGKFNKGNFSFIDDKKAYPNYDQYMYIPGKRDTDKWLAAVKIIYNKKKNGMSHGDAIRQATNGWNKMETFDFLNWLKFYEEGAHMKYKFAQVWYENGQPGYFLHIKPDAVEPTKPLVDNNAVNDAREEADHTENKKQVIEKQRQKIIGRLDSAEKLLRSQEGQMFAGKELENLMEAIYSLKKKVQLVNKISASIRLYEDMIVREANVLSRNGFVKAANMLYAVAQTPSASAEGAKGKDSGGAIPSPSPPDDPSGAGHPGAPGGLPATIPGVPNVNTPVGQDQNKDQPTASALSAPTEAPGTVATTPPLVPQEAPQPPGITAFIENMNNGKFTDDLSESNDDLEIHDHLDVEDSEAQLMVSEAQMFPPIDVPMTDDPPPARSAPMSAPIVNPPSIIKSPDLPLAPPVADEPLEVTEDDIPSTNKDMTTPDPAIFDKKVDEMFADLTISDIVSKLEDLAKIFKVREIPRQLAIVDMMLDSLGLASYFPSLSEAQNKALDSNNYISTRVEDILSKLRGAMVTKEIDLTSGSEDKPEIAGIKGKLEQDSVKEKQRKQMRKDQESAELDNEKKETPKVELAEDLKAPIPVAPIPKPII